MKGFISFADPFREFISNIVRSDRVHGKWLNTLSYLENCGARKIARCEHPTKVKEEVLKHAAEEFRHAHYLKKQIKRVSDEIEDYSLRNILGGIYTLHYINALDVQASRYLSSEVGLASAQLKEAAYILVTYAIELRAAELYPIYDQCLRMVSSQVTVKSILLEEKEHLLEMEQGIHTLSSGDLLANRVCAIEGALCKKWITSIK